jgi:hypothetical protein
MSCHAVYCCLILVFQVSIRWNSAVPLLFWVDEALNLKFKIQPTIATLIMLLLLYHTVGRLAFSYSEMLPTQWIFQIFGRSRDSAVGIATGYGLEDQEVGVRVPVGSRIFSSPRRPVRLWGPPSLLSNGYRGVSRGVKRQGRETDHSPPTIVGLYIHSPIRLHGVVLN